MYKTKTRLYKVYHIHEKGNTDLNEGYVGVTRHSIQYRLGQHFCSKRPVGAILRSLGRDNVEIDQLAMLPKEDALAMEYNLRPKMNMGWNVRAGGNRSTVFCPVCGKPLPKSRSGTVCAICAHRPSTKFTEGHKPANYGKGEHYKLTAPDGNVYTPEAFTAFCREHDLTSGNLRQVAKGLRHHSKGWKAERID